MTARTAILARLRTALQVPADDTARKAAVAARLKSAPNGVIPARGQLPAKAQIELFIAMAEKYSATVTRLTGRPSGRGAPRVPERGVRGR